ncbi:MAG: AraC family transcriptional regulator [Bdellovibrionales bacterium]|nr:AraC family transcriptional regulator [Bdellovibrionales bacterium]
MNEKKEQPSDRKCFRISAGLFRMDQEIEIEGSQEGYDGTGPYWVVGHVIIRRGSIKFLVDEVETPSPGKSFLMVMPKNSVVSVVANQAITKNRALFSRELEVRHMPDQPFACRVPEDIELENIPRLEALLKDSIVKIPISRTTQPHEQSNRVKNYLGQNFKGEIGLNDLAEVACMTPEALSRRFKKDWGKSPIQYRNWLRVLESFRLISEENAITDVALESGFNDLSRFHKQFKATVGHTPLSIRKRSKNAKK